jgi:hypothetical protein
MRVAGVRKNVTQNPATLKRRVQSLCHGVMTDKMAGIQLFEQKICHSVLAIRPYKPRFGCHNYLKKEFKIEKAAPIIAL